MTSQRLVTVTGPPQPDVVDEDRFVVAGRGTKMMPFRRAAAGVCGFVLLAFLAFGTANVQAQQVDDLVALNQQAVKLFQAGKYAEATELAKRVLVEAEKRLGPEHPNVGIAANNLADFLRAQGRTSEAEPFYKRALAIAEKLGPEQPNVAINLNNLAELYRGEGRYDEAEPLYQRALAIAEKAFGPDHPNVGTLLSNMAGLYRGQGRYGDAEPLMKRALSITEKALGPDHPDVGIRLNNLGDLYEEEGRYTEAEPLIKRALAITEKARGPEHPDVAIRLNNLATLYRAEGRAAEAEPLLRRALAISEKALGPDHPDVGIRLNNLAELYDAMGRHADAEPLLKRALAIAEKARGPDHPDVATRLNNLAKLYHEEGRYADAEPLLKRALAINEKALGVEHANVGKGLGNLAELYIAEGRAGEAEPLLTRALAIDEKAYGADHPIVSMALDNLADYYFEQSDWARAADDWRESTAVITRRARLATAIGAGQRSREAKQVNWPFLGFVKAAHRLTQQKGDDAALAGETFESAQWALSSQAAQSLAQMAARGAKGEAKLAALVRERQDLAAEWQRRDLVRTALVALVADARQQQAATEADNSARLAEIDRRIAGIDSVLAEKFPDYATLASPSPLSVGDVQAQLSADEALVLFLDTPKADPTPEETFIWVVTKSDMRWVRSELGTSALVREVAALRCGLDYEGAWLDDKGDWKGSRCESLLNVAYGSTDHDTLGKPLPFDLARAHALYEALFGSIADLIGNKHLLIVPSGPLTQLPFQVLVTEPAKAALPSAFAQYRDVAWLARRNAVTILPAVSSLKALRQYAKLSHATAAYIGFGDPLLEGRSGDEKEAKRARDKRCEPMHGTQIASLELHRGAPAVSRGSSGLADVSEIRQLPPLPETADEVCDVANDLGADPATAVHLGAAATEAEVKLLSSDGTLAKNKIIHFATHGALAGELSRDAEPGLILTPPAAASDTDDGYLAASEIAALKLDADWVILSACNTAAGNAEGAEALSGLARAFFYAGARSLLVSHWEVASEPTVALITKAVAELAANPKIGRAEALRRSMVKMIDERKAFEAHPAYWAPFVLVGEGGAAR
jgi:CHAT domain-containing protein/tetratricopeptide (TPR) repeat protein